MNKDKSFFSLSNIIILSVAVIYALVMLIGGFNFLSVVALALAMAASLALLIIYLVKKQFNWGLWMSFLVLISAVLLFYIIRGAEPFGKRLGYNLLWAGIPIVIAVFLRFNTEKLNYSFKKVVSVVLIMLMLFSASFYFLIISIRVKPTVQSLQKGHDEYLNSIKRSVSDSSPNVLVILMDDLAYSDISSFSYLGRENATIQTPNLDTLADDGIVMENFYACSPVCSPSRFGLLTGRYSARGHLDHVVFPTAVSLDPFGDTRYFNSFTFNRNVDGILGDEITFAEVMQRAGYNTGLFGKWNLGDYGQYLPTNQGFDYFFGSYYVNDMTPYNIVRETNGKGEEVFSHAEMKDQSETTKILTQEIDSYIQSSLDNNEKFLAFYSTPWPHYPIYSGEKYNTSDDSYIHCIEEFDLYLGMLTDMLKERGAYDDTLIIFTSDNGPGREGVAGALRGRKGTTFDGGQKVPLIATYAGGGIGKGEYLQASNTISARAMNIDLFSTILQYIGIDELPSDRIIDGVSLFDLWQGNISGDTPVHSTLYHIRSGKVQAIQMPVLVNGELIDFKYYKKVASENTAFFDQTYRNYLFNLTSDPAEGYDISMVYPAVAETLDKTMQEFIVELKNNRRGIKSGG